ncbi:hypothetical protein QMO37_32825 [Pseudomonas aeruginosa]|uniref:hypothetical protein n=1 Tax=Pseudomonas aeruginosa TaxID=287 RepID=UPI0024AFC92B|nr:hypothetical protein [Pseudomonas aeruginosa]MDI7059515.1 hypothetical protein [Pseudomonas aeruginosa]
MEYKNIFEDPSSDVPDGENWFAAIEPSLSNDRLLRGDFSFGPMREWLVAFDY